MPTIQGVEVALAAGQIQKNAVAGSAYEFAPYHARADIAVVGNAAGDQRVTVQTGAEVLLEESPVSRQNRQPVWPDDYTLSDVVAKGDRIKIQIRNTGGAAVDTFWAVRLTPL